MTLEQRLSFFNNFLMDNDVYDKYYSNVSNYIDVSSYGGIHQFMIKICEATDPRIMITSPFAWERTPEGSEVWVRISQKWEQRFK